MKETLIFPKGTHFEWAYKTRTSEQLEICRELEYSLSSEREDQ